jgi:L-fuconolactonase
MEPLIDSHFHLWRQADMREPGIAAHPHFGGDIAWEDYAAARGPISLTGAIAVQVDQDPGDGEPEVEFFERAAADHPELRGIVAFAPVEGPDLAGHIDRLSRHPLVCGIRRSTQHEADDAYCAREDFIAGVRLLGQRGVVCDICARHWQLESVIAMARACPDTTIVVNHLGKPDVQGGSLDPWRENMSRLAAMPNVFLKLSVVVQSPEDDNWTEATVAPYAAHLLSEFGPERMMWASNWPVAALVTPYGDWLAAAQSMTAHLPEAARRQIFHDTAAAVYGLGS